MAFKKFLVSKAAAWGIISSDSRRLIDFSFKVFEVSVLRYCLPKWLATDCIASGSDSKANEAAADVGLPATPGTAEAARWVGVAKLVNVVCRPALGCEGGVEVSVSILVRFEDFSPVASNSHL